MWIARIVFLWWSRYTRIISRIAKVGGFRRLRWRFACKAIWGKILAKKKMEKRVKKLTWISVRRKKNWYESEVWLYDGRFHCCKNTK